MRLREDQLSIPRLDALRARAAARGAKPAPRRRRARSAAARARCASSRASSRSRRPCAQCNGQGRSIPNPCRRVRGAGARAPDAHAERQDPRRRRHGLAPEAARRGRERRHGGPPGDLYVVLDVDEHPTLRARRQRPGLRGAGELPQAALGAEIEVPTLDGKAKMKIPAGTQSGQRVPAHAARASPTCTATAAATSWCASSSRRRASSPPAQRELLEEFARIVRRGGAPDVEELPRQGQVDARVGVMRRLSATCGEHAWIARHRRPPRCAVGPRDRRRTGDDAAVIQRDVVRWSLTTDALVEGVHFRRRWLSPAALGRRAFA